MQNKLTAPHKLINSDGRLVESGWTDHLILEYDPRDIKLNRMNIKEWDSYIIISSSGEYALSMCFADKRYTGLVNACFYDIKNGRQYEFFNPKVLPGAKICLPRTSESGSVVFKDSLCELMFLVTGNDRHLYCRYSSFFGNELEVNVHLGFDRSDASVVVAAPFDSDGTQFCLNQKIPCMPASGYVRLNSDEYPFSPQSDFGVLDWGRGVWTQSCDRLWCSGSGVVNSKRFGFNLGYGLGNMSSAGENAVFYDGVCHKLGRVVIEPPFGDVNKPWKVRSEDKRFEAEIMPSFNCETKHSLSILNYTEKMMFGKMSGSAVLDDGTAVTVSELSCFCERTKNKY